MKRTIIIAAICSLLVAGVVFAQGMNLGGGPGGAAGKFNGGSVYTPVKAATTADCSTVAYSYNTAGYSNTGITDITGSENVTTCVNGSPIITTAATSVTLAQPLIESVPAGTEALLLTTSTPATVGSPIRAGGYLDFGSKLWDGAASIEGRGMRLQGIVDTQAGGVPSTYHLSVQDASGAEKASINENGAIRAVYTVEADSGYIKMGYQNLFGAAQDGVKGINQTVSLCGAPAGTAGTEVAVRIGADVAMATAGQKLISVLNATSEKFYVDYLGNVSANGGFIGPRNPRVLSRSQVDVGAAPGATALFVVPTGLTCLVTEAWIRSASGTFNQATDPVFNIGWAAVASGVVPSATYTTPSGTGTAVKLGVVTAEQTLGTTGQTLNFNLETAATASTTAVVDVYGNCW